MSNLISTKDNATRISEVAINGELTISNSTVNGFDVVEDLTGVTTVHILNDAKTTYTAVSCTFGAGAITYNTPEASVATSASNELNWVETVSTTVSTQPAELVIDGTSTPTTLVTNTLTTTGQKLSLYNATDGVKDGVLGAVTSTPTYILGAQIPAGAGSVSNFTNNTSIVGNWTVLANDVTTQNSSHSTTAAIYYNASVLNGVTITDSGAGASYSQTSLLSLFDPTQSITPINHYSSGWTYRGIMILGTHVRTTEYDYSTDYDVPAGSVVHTVGSYVSIDPRIHSTTATSYPLTTNQTDPYYVYWSSRGFFQWKRYRATNTWYWIPTQSGLDTLRPIVSANTSSPVFTLGMVELGTNVVIIINDEVVAILPVTTNYGLLTRTAIQDQDYTTNPVWSAPKLYASLYTKYTADISALSLTVAPTKAFEYDNTKVSVCLEDVTERVVNEVNTYKTVEATSTTTALHTTEVMLTGERVVVDGVDALGGTVTGTAPYVMDITTHGLSVAPTEAYTKGGQDLTFVSSTTTEYVGTNATSGLIKTGDTIQAIVSGLPVEVASSNSVESPAGTYTITIPLQASAPTGAKVLDRSKQLSVTSKLFDGTKFNYTYGGYVKNSYVMSTKVEASKSGTTVLAPQVTAVNKAG